MKTLMYVFFCYLNYLLVWPTNHKNYTGCTLYIITSNKLKESKKWKLRNNLGQISKFFEKTNSFSHFVHTLSMSKT